MMGTKRSRQTAFTRVYLVGKIEKNDWRHELFPDLRTSLLSNGIKAEATADGFIYTGPYFVSCGHGCAHGPGQHGRGVDGGGCFSDLSDPDQVRAKVAQACLKAIDSSSFLFCWLEDLTVFGSLFELGYAKAKGKQIFIALKKREPGAELSTDLWLALTQAQKWIEAESALDAWTNFRAWMRRRKQVAGLRSEFKPMTKPQERYILHLIDRCEGLRVADEATLLAIDVGTAGAMIDCFNTGGDPVRDFPEIFEWRVQNPDDANSLDPIRSKVNIHGES